MTSRDTDAAAGDAIDSALDAADALAGLRVAPEHRPGVRTHLEVGLSIAARIGETGREAAPVFRP